MSKVYLVGAGPGDPLLLTIKGQRLLERADAILYDHLANEELLAHAPHRAERVYVGKKKSDHTFTQEEISAMLIQRAKAGQMVVRLKGGDPYLFGRGGEEAEALAAAGIPFEVVPGVTAPLGIAAYSGVPLTHREHTSVVTCITGHSVDNIEWSKVSGSETLVIFMGLAHLADIVERLIAAGRDPATPAIAVRWATRPNQTTVTATLADLPARIEEAGLRPPATVVIGPVVQLHEKLNWFERLPLFGQRIVVTRPAGQASDFVMRLQALGAHALELPAIAIRPAPDYRDLDEAIANLTSFDWIIFTSVNGVRFFFERMDRSATDIRAIRGRICAIGPATAAALEKLHLKIDLMPSQYVAEEIVTGLEKYDLRDKHILLPRAAVARDLIPKELARRGAHVCVAESYRNEVPEYAHEHAREVLAQKPHWVTFTSTSTVNNFIAIAGHQSLAGVKIASIGPITTAALRAHGLEPVVQAEQFTTDGLVEAIVRYGA